MKTAGERLDELYARIPSSNCKGLCGATVCTAITLGTRERSRLEAAAGRPLEAHDDGTRCGYLVEGKCAAYDARPFICRLWGTTSAARCEHGCEPERVLSHAETAALFRQWERVRGRLVRSPIVKGDSHGTAGRAT